MRGKLVVTLCILLALMFSFSALADFSDCMIDGYIVNCKQYVTVRSRPSTKASAVDRAYLGEDVTVLSRTAYTDGNDYFVLVETDRSIGYILITYLDIYYDSTQLRDTYGIGYGTVTANDPTVDLILRTGPGTGYNIMGYLFGGEVIPSLGRAEADENGRLWYYCMMNGTGCWISSKYTRLRRPN